MNDISTTLKQAETQCGDYFDRFNYFNSNVQTAVHNFVELQNRRHSDDVDILFDDYREYGGPIKTISFLGMVGILPNLENDVVLRQITTSKEKIIQDRYSGSVNGIAIVRRVYSLPRERDAMPDGFAGGIIRAVRNEKLAADAKKIKLEGYKLLGSIAYRQYADNCMRQQTEVVYINGIKILSQLSA